MGKGFRKDCPLFGQAINMRCFQMFVAVTAQPVRSQGVYCDQKDIQPGFCRIILRIQIRGGKAEAEKKGKKDRNTQDTIFLHFGRAVLTDPPFEVFDKSFHLGSPFRVRVILEIVFKNSYRILEV